ncbi:MAG: DNA primase noncatalytic subunit PriX [Sulfolobaceae archaeon]
MKRKERQYAKKFDLYYPNDSYAGYVIFDGIYSKIFDENNNLLFEVLGRFPPKQRKNKDNYEWIDKIIELGLEDCRKRFILYVASRYLINVKGLDDEKVIDILREFYYKKGGGKIYDSWLRSVIKGVREKKLLPWSLDKIKNKDKELYNMIINKIKNDAITQK